MNVMNSTNNIWLFSCLIDLQIHFKMKFWCIKKNLKIFGIPTIVSLITK